MFGRAEKSPSHYSIFHIASLTQSVAPVRRSSQYRSVFWRRGVSIGGHEQVAWMWRPDDLAGQGASRVLMSKSSVLPE